MKRTPAQLWTRFQQLYFEFPACGLALDLSRLDLADDFLPRMEAPMKSCFAAMAQLEGGSIANPDENRRVGHYWLRHAALAPLPEFGKAINAALGEIRAFVARVHSGQIAGAGGTFTHLLVVGIGGSALGPQFVADALGHPCTDRLEIRFLDNTDPDGIDRTLATLASHLARTLVVVISKSGSTPETRNGMLEAAAAYQRAGLSFARHAVAVTQLDDKSALFRQAATEDWLARFPMWDWVGGRTSVTSAVGLLPAALQGFDIDLLLAGARACDEVTRVAEVRANPAALLALAWYHAGEGRGTRDMVVLPYKDRLSLFSKYLQQLIMESLGKELDLAGRVVNQGIAVYGNKGSTDQHAYVQQLREGLNNFFATFIEVLHDREGASIEVAPCGVTAGDFLHGLFLGTRAALFEKQRQSVTLTIHEVNAFSLGVLVALFERTVGLYAFLVNINAYHQPGVEAGKLAAAEVIKAKTAIVTYLRANPGRAFSAEDLAAAVGSDPETVFKTCEHVAANLENGVRKHPGTSPTRATYQA